MSRSIKRAGEVTLLSHERRHPAHIHHGPAGGRPQGLPLCMAGSGRVVRVVKVRSGSGLARKLADMGLVPGAEIRLLNCQGAGPVVIDLKGSRLALGHGMAMKVMVEEV